MISLKTKNQSGQVIIILLLLMLVGLSVGLALTQRSVTDVATSTQGEQSSRAFSAAEAGLEKALSGSIPLGGAVTLDNSSQAQVALSPLLPITGTFSAIEYPPIGRETTAQFWFVDPTLAVPTSFYNNNGIDLYFGNAGTTDKPAVEVRIIMLSNNNFYTKNYYFDSDPARAAANGFMPVTCAVPEILANGILGVNHSFYCKKTIGNNSPAANIPFPDLGNTGQNCPNASCMLIMARVRLLYVNENHSLALAPRGSAQFPPQIQIYNATGTSGQSEKQIQAFRVKDVVPPWFDFAIFSVNEIIK